jgi:hypothetical protein
MEYKQKCKYCGALLSNTNSVFIHINRYDDEGRSAKQIWMCCKCWDNTRIQVSSTDCIVKFNADYFKCGNCHHLIFKDYDHKDGTCRVTRLHRNFNSPCVYEEEMT